MVGMTEEQMQQIWRNQASGNAANKEYQTRYGTWTDMGGGKMQNAQTGQTMNAQEYNSWIGQQESMRLAGETEAKRVADLKAQGLNADGSPIAPETRSLIDKGTGKLGEKYLLDLKTLDPNSLEGFNMLKQLATTKSGESEFAKFGKGSIDLQRQDTIDAATRQSAGAQADARSSMAMRGGISSGARERLASGGMRDILASKQGAFRQSNANILEMLKQEEAMKRDAGLRFGEAEGKLAMGNLGIENQETQFNLGTLLKEEDLSRQTEMDKYKAALDKWAAGKQADATAKSGGGGGGK